MEELGWSQLSDHDSPIIKVPLQFNFPPVEAISKQLTKLNSNHLHRIVYLGPRWDNTLIFHKKYSAKGQYEFKQRKISKNSTFLYDSMSHNQFYKAQIYYRAFEGMNPTLNASQQLIFESRFQSGNLDCAIKISENQYDLFLRIDSNTRGNLFWYYFSITAYKRREKVKINLCNLTKSDTHYAKGLNPFMFSSKTKEWSQSGMSNVTFQQKLLRYQFLYEKMKVGNFYQLSFEVQFGDEEELRFAYCIPYTYSDLLSDLKSLTNQAEIGILGQTLTGVNIPLVMIGRPEKQVAKKVILITGRVHPGQTNSSIILSNLMKYLCSSPEATPLREKVITLVVPMINPDGVILGNSRTGASGKDLNRLFKTKCISIFPQVVLLKNLVSKISETHELDTYLDFHGHSRKDNMFIFGPPYSIAQSQYYKCRVFPKLLSNITPLFRYYSCTYDIPHCKRQTARAVMLGQMNVPFVFTIQTSLGFYHDHSLHKNIAFSRTKWEQIGKFIVDALKQYYESIQQYEQFIQQKRAAKKIYLQELKHKNNSFSQLNPNKQSISFREKDIKALDQLIITKLYAEIRQMEEKKKKREKESDDQSDSHNQEEQLEKEKMYEFQSMITECIQQEQKKLINTYEIKKKISINQGRSSEQAKNRLLISKNRQRRFKEQERYLNEIQEIKEKQKRVEKKVGSKLNNEAKYIPQKNDRKYVVSEQIKRTHTLKNNIQKSVQIRKAQSSNRNLNEDVVFVSLPRKPKYKTNIKMFNFSKMVINSRSSLYHQNKEFHKFSNQRVKYKKDLSNQRQNLIASTLEHEINSNKPNYVNLDYIRQDQSMSPASRQEMSPKPQLKNTRAKIGFPSSFYRIKYVNYQKKMELKKDKSVSQFHQYQTKNEQSRHQKGYSNNIMKPQSQNQSEVNNGLFIKINKFPMM